MGVNKEDLMIFSIGSVFLLTGILFKREHLARCTQTESTPDRTKPAGQFVQREAIKLDFKEKLGISGTILYFGLINSSLLSLISTCTLSLNLQPASIILFGVAFSGSSLYVALRGEVTPGGSTILSTLMLGGFLILGLALPRECISVDDGRAKVQSLLVLVPVSSIFLGGASGLLTCELLSLVSLMDRFEFRYSFLVVVQGLWSSILFIIPQMKVPGTYFIISSVFTVLYCFSALILHARIKLRRRRVEKNQLLSHNNDNCNSSIPISSRGQ